MKTDCLTCGKHRMGANGLCRKCSKKEVDEFLIWLEEQPGGYVNPKTVEKNFPEFEFDLVGVTCIVRNGETMVPKRDYKDAVIYGNPLD